MSSPPSWLAVLISILPTIGVVTGVVFFCFHRYQKYLRTFFRLISLANWIVFEVSVVLTLILVEVSDGVSSSEWVVLVCVFASWGVMMVESYTCREREYISSLTDKESAVMRIEELMKEEPQVQWLAKGCTSTGIICLPFQKTKVRCILPVVDLGGTPALNSYPT